MFIKWGMRPVCLRSFATTYAFVNQYDIDGFKKFLVVDVLQFACVF